MLCMPLNNSKERALIQMSIILHFIADVLRILCIFSTYANLLNIVLTVRLHAQTKFLVDLMFVFQRSIH